MKLSYLLLLINLYIFSIAGFSQSGNLNDITGPKLWLRADQGVVQSSGVVSQWTDQSSNSNNAVQSTLANRPAFIASNSNLNGYPTIKFDGVDDFLSATTTNGIFANSFTLFVISNGESQSTTNSVILSSGSSSTGFWLTRRPTNQRIASFTKNFFLQGSTTVLPSTGYNFKLFGVNKVQGSSFTVKVNTSNEFSTTNTAATGSYTNALYQLGAGSAGNFFKGEIAEIVLYPRELTPSEQTQVEKYLMDKYAPPISLGADINSNYGLCNITLAPTGYYTSYLWNTGATTSSLSLNQPGEYWVQGTDVFGRISRDTIQITRPVYDSIQLTNRVVCYNDFQTITAFVPSDYQFVSWSDGVTTPTRTLSQAQILSYSITDNSSCNASSNDMYVTIDSSLQNVTLGLDTSLCEGNLIELQTTSPSIISYLWNTGNTNSSQPITTNGNYSLLVSNSNNCLKRDTINVSIIGQAPTIVYNFPSSICQNESVSFSHTSTVSGSTVLSQLWNFGNGVTYSSASGIFSNNIVGNYSGNLKVISSGGCQSIVSFNYVVNAKPTASFNSPLICQNSPTTFVNTSIVPNGTSLTQSSWYLNSNLVGTSTDLNTTLSLLGSNSVQLIISSSNSCSDTVTQQVTVSNNYPVPNSVGLVAPFNSKVTLINTPISFSWSSDVNNYFYKFQISQQPDFSSIVYELNTSSTTLDYTPTIEGTYYWRVKTNNPCSNGANSQVYNFSVIALTNNLKLWLNSSTGVTQSSGAVSSWADQSGQSNTCIQNTTANRPILVSSVSELNNLPAVRFDGTNDYFTGTLISNFGSSSFTIFVVSNGESQSSSISSLFSVNTAANGFYFCRRPSSNKFGIFNNNTSLNSVATFPSTGYSYKVLSGNKILGTSFGFKTNGVTDFTSTLTGATTAFTNANYQLGAGNTFNFFKGDIAEVILFSRSLSSPEQSQVEKYLMDKYAPPINLGADIYDTYGFEDITLSTPGFYTNYQWNTGATTASISINNPGQYILSGTDIFGRVSKDTINVTRPHYSTIQLTNQMVCYNGNTSITAPMPSGNYSFVQWSDGVTSQTRSISQTVSLSYTISDNASFTRTSNTAVISFDYSLQNVTLGNDTTLCLGNSIQLQTTSPSITTYLWNTGNTSSSQLLTNNGEYSILVTNSYNCFKRDTINISINGQTPTVSFNFPSTFCQNESVSFSHNSTASGGSILGQLWSFGDGVTNSSASGIFSNNIAGNYLGNLKVITSDGCQSIVPFSYVVKPKPSASFNYQPICLNTSTTFVNTSTVPSGTSLSQTSWYVNSNLEGASSDLNYTLSSLGSNSVRLIISSSNSCTDTITQLVNVSDNYPVPNSVGLVAPFNSKVTLVNDPISFSWSTATDNYFYKFQISQESNFSTTVYELTTTSTTTNYTPTTNGTYYWRVKTNNPCSIGSNSQVYYFSVISLSDSLKLWLRADQGVTQSSGVVSQWTDQSLNSNNAVQSTLANRPAYVTSNSNLNGYPTLKFDGVNDALSGTTINGFNDNSFTLFVIGNGESQSTSNSVIFSTGATNTGFWLVRRPDLQRIALYAKSIPLIGSTTVLPSTGYNFKLFGVNKVLGSNITLKLNGTNEITSANATATGTFTNALYQLGANSGGSLFKGEIAEVVLFKRVLSATEQAQVEKYLMDKYAPPVNLGADIVDPYGFEDITLSSSGFYTNYLWSTGATTASISINNPGQYFLTGTDIFGRVSKDTINIVRPDYSSIQLANQTVCYNGNTSITAPMPTGNYTFVQWSDGVTTQTRSISQNVSLSYTLRDNANFTKTSNTALISFDNSLQNVALGNDTTLCMGNSIHLQTTSPSITTYLWNTGNTSPIQNLQTTGEYSLEVRNLNSCLKTDTIFVTILGESPVVSLNFPAAICQNESASFSHNSTVSGGSVSSQLWSFGNGITNSSASGIFSNNIVGNYSGNLKVVSSEGCQSIVPFSYDVKPKPTASFSSPLICQNAPATFVNTSTVPNGTSLTQTSWYVNSNLVGSTSDLIYTLSTLASNSVRLIISTSNSCSDTVTQQVNVSNNYPIPNSVSLVSPFNSKVTLANEPISFSWSNATDNYFYNFQISQQPSFVTTVYELNTTSATINYTPSTNGTYYWRVKTNNPCYVGSYSQVYNFSVITLSDSLKLWLRADQGVTQSSGVVSEWTDQSLNSNNAVQSTLANRPGYVTSNSNLNGYPTLKFDGINDALSGTTINGINNSSFTLFVIGNGESQSTTNSAIFSVAQTNTGFWLVRRPDIQRIAIYAKGIPINGSTTILPSTGYNFKLFGVNKVFGSNVTLKVNGINEISSANATVTGTFTNALYQLGANSGGSLFKGEIAEVVLFKRVLSSTEQTQVEKYLMDKYAPPVNLGADISSTYGFCDTVLASGGYYTSYLWSNGATTATISVNNPGQYWLQGIDIFGRTSRDTIVVTRPNYSSISLTNRTVCYNAPITETATIPSGNYQFVSWSDGLTNPSRLLTENDTINYTVSDNRGCTKTSNDAIITLDNSLEQVSLGADTSLCVGNILQLQSSSPSITTYTWNSGNVNPTQVVTNTGNYWLRVGNNNNCFKTDTISITIIGQAPTLIYNVPSSVCQSAPFNFSETSTIIGSTISSRSWTINNVFTSDQSTGTTQLNQVGNIPINLEVVAANGCRSVANFNLTVNAKPQINFTTQNVCPYDGIVFIPSNLVNVNLSSYDWNFGQASSSSNTSTVHIPSHVYGQAGSYNVELRSVDINGCKDTVIQTVVVQEAPVANFTVQNACERSTTVINNTSTIGSSYSITTNSWDYGDGTFALNPTIAKEYNEYGNFTVRLIAIANNGCRDTIEKPITIYPSPVLNWQISPSCKSSLTSFESLSTIPEGSIVSTDWLVNLQYPFVGNSASYRFATLGVQYLNLSTTSDLGCISDTLILVNVNPELKSDFTIDPVNVVAGVPITFHDTSIGASSSIWDLALGLDPVTYSPPVPSVQATYLENYINDSIYVSLITGNAFGCKDTIIKRIIIGEPRFDLSISNIYYQDNNGFNTVGVELFNNGSLSIKKVDLIVTSLNSLPLKETWTGNLDEGQSEIYIFKSKLSSFVSTQDQFENYLCVEGTPSDDFNSQDLIVSNNKVCKNTESSNLVVMPIYPNPTSSIAYCSLYLPSLDMVTTINITLYSPNGEIIKKVVDNQEAGSGIFEYQIDFTHLESGLYLLKVEDGITTRVVRVSKL